MIVRPDKSYEIHSMFPNSNWYENEPDNLVVDETTEEGRALARKIIDNYPHFDLVIQDGKLVDVIPYPPPVNLEALREAKHKELLAQYVAERDSVIVSSVTGEEVTFGYSEDDQKNYQKIANLFSLDAEKTTQLIGTRSHGVITLTREQFIQFARECDAHEMNLYTKLINLENQLNSATTKEEIEAIGW